MAKGHMDTNDIRVRTYKVMIAALAGYINDLDTVMNPPKNRNSQNFRDSRITISEKNG